MGRSARPSKQTRGVQVSAPLLERGAGRRPQMSASVFRSAGSVTRQVKLPSPQRRNNDGDVQISACVVGETNISSASAW